MVARPTFYFQDNTLLNKIQQLHIDIDTRVNIIREQHPDWLCRQGCDGCCHRLAEIPLLTQAEWHLLQKGLEALQAHDLQKISQEMNLLQQQTSRPIVCPMLDNTTGACLVYSHRPIACRTYGFYVQRHLGVYCKDIEASVAAGELAEVVWGNHDAIDQQLSHLGNTKALTEWFTHWQNANLTNESSI